VTELIGYLLMFLFGLGTGAYYFYDLGRYIEAKEMYEEMSGSKYPHLFSKAAGDDEA